MNRTVSLFALLGLLALVATLAGCAGGLAPPSLPTPTPAMDELHDITNQLTPTLPPAPTVQPTGTPIPVPSPDVIPTAIPARETLSGRERAVLPGETGPVVQQSDREEERLALRNDSAESQPEQAAAPDMMHRMAAAMAQPSPTPTRALPEQVFLEMNHTYQRRNNCAPAATSMALSTFGLYKSQFEMAGIQKPNAADVNVTAEEVAVSIREVGLEAYVGYNGTIEVLQQLVAAGIPVLTEEWMSYDGGMGHFRVIRGYDRVREQIIYNDSFYGPNRWRSYDAMREAWKPYNNKFVIPYRPEQEATVKAIVGPGWDSATMIETLRANMEAQIGANPQDPYAWWGLGEALLSQGEPAAAVEAFERSLEIGLPWRYQWYRYGYFNALNRNGQHEKVLAVTEPVLRQMGLGEDLRYQQAVALMALDRVDEARLELRRALNDNPRFAPAAHLLATLDEQ